MTLFEVDPPAPADQLSPDRRRTQRQRQLLAAGVHPATRRPLLVATSETCADCRFATYYSYHSRGYWKCDKVGTTHSAATDIRIGWPACALFERADG